MKALFIILSIPFLIVSCGTGGSKSDSSSTSHSMNDDNFECNKLNSGYFEAYGKLADSASSTSQVSYNWNSKFMFQPTSKNQNFDGSFEMVNNYIFVNESKIIKTIKYSGLYKIYGNKLNLVCTSNASNKQNSIEFEIIFDDKINCILQLIALKTDVFPNFWNRLSDMKYFHNSKINSNQPNNPVIGNSLKIGTLEVAQNDFSESLNYNEAVSACKSLGDGWRLPNKDELNNILYKNQEKIGGFNCISYWSSTSDDNLYGYFQYFTSGVQEQSLTSNKYCVRAVRNLE